MKKQKHPILISKEIIANSIPETSASWREAVLKELAKLVEGAIYWEMVKNLPRHSMAYVPDLELEPDHEILNGILETDSLNPDLFKSLKGILKK